MFRLGVGVLGSVTLVYMLTGCGGTGVQRGYRAADPSQSVSILSLNQVTEDQEFLGNVYFKGDVEFLPHNNNEFISSIPSAFVEPTDVFDDLIIKNEGRLVLEEEAKVVHAGGFRRVYGPLEFAGDVTLATSTAGSVHACKPTKSSATMYLAVDVPARMLGGRTTINGLTLRGLSNNSSTHYVSNVCLYSTSATGSVVDEASGQYYQTSSQYSSSHFELSVLEPTAAIQLDTGKSYYIAIHTVCTMPSQLYLMRSTLDYGLD